jgi:hypothetical protein
MCRRHCGVWFAGDAGGRAESRLLRKMERLGLLPLELLAWPLWRELATVRLAERAPVRLALVQAWDKRDQAPLYWSRVQRQALTVARQAPRVVRELSWCGHG